MIYYHWDLVVVYFCTMRIDILGKVCLNLYLQVIETQKWRSQAAFLANSDTIEPLVVMVVIISLEYFARNLVLLIPMLTTW